MLGLGAGGLRLDGRVLQGLELGIVPGTLGRQRLDRHLVGGHGGGGRLAGDGQVVAHAGDPGDDGPDREHADDVGREAPENDTDHRTGLQPSATRPAI